MDRNVYIIIRKDYRDGKEVANTEMSVYDNREKAVKQLERTQQKTGGIMEHEGHPYLQSVRIKTGQNTFAIYSILEMPLH